MINYVQERVEYFKLYKVVNDFDNTSQVLIDSLTEFGYNIVRIHHVYQRAKIANDKAAQNKFDKMLAPFSEYRVPRGVSAEDVENMDKKIDVDIFEAAYQHCFATGRILHSEEARGLDLVECS